MRKRIVTLLSAPVLGVAGCGEANAPDREDEPPTREETTLSPDEPR